MPKPDVFILPGLKPVQELLKKMPEQILEIFARSDIAPSILNLAEAAKIPVEIVDSSALDKLCFQPERNNRLSHQGLAAKIRGPQHIPFASLLADCAKAPLPLILALDQVQDPGNLGSIARLGWGLGCPGLLLPEYNSASAGPAAFRTSAGALALLPICEVTNLARALDEAAEQGFTIYGAASQTGAQDAYNLAWQLPAILVLGSESKGIRPGVAKRCEHMISIPMARPFDSLNVAQAAAILTALCSASARFKSI